MWGKGICELQRSLNIDNSEVRKVFSLETHLLFFLLHAPAFSLVVPGKLFILSDPVQRLPLLTILSTFSRPIATFTTP